MSMQKYSVTPHPIETLLTWVKSGEIAIPEIQRPFVWDASKVRNLLDSLYLGYPVGYLISWRNPSVKLKDGTTSSGKRILIDGQQRVTALMAAMLGREVLTKEYQTVRIKIAFNPLQEKFEVANPAIQKDPSWIYDVAEVFAPDSSLMDLTDKYHAANPAADKSGVSRILENLRKIVNNHVGIIELDGDLDIDTVTEIFIRVNSEGSPLSQADFAMSKISVNETYGGNVLRKAIDYFCHMAVNPEFYKTIQANDPAFCATDLFQKMSWLKNEIDDIYDPSYTDMLRVAFTTEFKRGKLQDLVALLSGRNFATREFEESIVADSFARLRKSVLTFMNENHFKRFVMIIRSAGFVDSSLIGSQNALNAAYIVYLTLREQGVADADIERHVRRWFAFSVLTGRYSASPESTFDYDIRQIHLLGFDKYAQTLYAGELSEAFWGASLPQEMDTSASSSPYFRVFQAAQIKLGDRGFLSKDLTVKDLVEVKSDVHHLFPRDYLKKLGFTKGQYNQIANYAVTQNEINIAIGNKPPAVYMAEIRSQCSGGPKKYGNIVGAEDLKDNLAMNCIPEDFSAMDAERYPEFLARRRELMARKMQRWFEAL